MYNPPDEKREKKKTYRMNEFGVQKQVVKIKVRFRSEKESIFYFIFENPFVVICHRTKLIRSIFDRIMSTHSANGW